MSQCTCGGGRLQIPSHSSKCPCYSGYVAPQTADPAAPNPNCPPLKAITKCDLYVRGQKNVWVATGDSPADQLCDGVCLLDTMSTEQVIYSIERDRVARADLPKVTTDPGLLELLNTVPLLPAVEEADALQSDINRETRAGSNPFYAVFRGQPPFAQ